MIGSTTSRTRKGLPYVYGAEQLFKVKKTLVSNMFRYVSISFVPFRFLSLCLDLIHSLSISFAFSRSVSFRFDSVMFCILQGPKT